MRTAIILTLTLFFLYGKGFAVETVEPVIDEELLSYQFRTQRTISYDLGSSYGSIRYTDQSRMGGYRLVNHWRDDSLSFIIFRHDILTDAAIRQANRDVWSFMSHCVADLDGDGGDEITVTYLDGPNVWFEIIDVNGEFTYKRLLVTPEDRNQNGRWDGAVSNYATCDINGDGHAECLMTVFSGFDLYPRGLYCLDWKNDSLLWFREISGLPSNPILVEDDEGMVFTLLAMSSQGNAVATTTMDDRHSYVICIDAAGELLWTKELGGIFSWTSVEAIDTDDDGVEEALIWINPSSADVPGKSAVRGALLQVYGLDGTPGKSVQLPDGAMVRHLICGDLNRDGYDEIIVSGSDRHITVYDRQLSELGRYEFPAVVELWKCADFLGNGGTQLIVSTDDGKTMLLSSSFKLLAQTDDLFNFQFCDDFEDAFVESGRALLMQDRSQPVAHLLYFEKQPVLTIIGAFLVRNQGPLLGLFAALTVALIFTNYHRRKIGRNFEVISSQRDKLEQARNELQKTLADLKAAQTRLVQSQKMASLGMLVAGIAHEINSPLAAVTSSNNTSVRALSLVRRQVGQAGLDGQTEADLLESVSALENTNSSIGAGAEKVNQIVKKLRSFVRLDEAELQKVALADCLDETLELLPQQLKRRVLVNKQYADLPEISCYPGYLNQVFLNVLVNSVEAIADRGEITLKTYSEKGMAVIRISDTGAGIPSNSLERIFEPGYTTKGAGGGSGMGLSICHQIIQDHKGEIVVESGVGQGTSVTMRLPLELE